MIHTEDILVSLSSVAENSGEEPAKVTTQVEDEIPREEKQNYFMKTLRSMWQVLLAGILIALFLGSIVGVLTAQITQEQCLSAEREHMASNTKQLQMKISELQQLLNSTRQNFTLLGSEYGQLKLLVNATQHNLTLLSAENAQLSLLLQEKIRLQVENTELNIILNSTLDNCELLEEENRQLDLLLNESLDIINTVSAESKQLRLLLHDEQQTSNQLEAKYQHQHSILFSDKLSFLWRLCDKDTLQCSRCLPGWVEHASRCFFMSQKAEKWQKARSICIDMGGDLAVVLNAEDQEFLTNMTFEFVQQHPQIHFLSAWIGLQDMVKEGVYIWVNGKTVRKDVKYWRPMEPNNAIPYWDKDRAGQDCVAIVPPSHAGQENWLNSWDDIICGGKRHYLCESTALILSGLT
ncbi:low affinity immunoglobulin epsilon Fc receptor-like [Epinephelus fuscoguttatus]|uniref:low affinity immunoglobulin epsilon Fc receptor-like n=1 Tax=Epinephelus fuscoguttatus TaxID=293821 RepID=UPI0020D0BEEC|nr:low affinity immunoglobulin epsilon Fc receptor-like [Epinephelus fuscoguttatus]